MNIFAGRSTPRRRKQKNPLRLPPALGLDAEKRDGRGRVADGRERVLPVAVSAAAALAPDLPASVAGDLPASVAGDLPAARELGDDAGAGCARPGWAFPAAAGTCSSAAFCGVAGAVPRGSFGVRGCRFLPVRTEDGKIHFVGLFPGEEVLQLHGKFS